MDFLIFVWRCVRVRPCRLTLDNSSKQFQCGDLADHRKTTSNAKNNVPHRSLDETDKTEREHNDTDEESINLDENGTDSDDLDYLTNLINISDINENIENTKEGDKEIRDVVYDGSKLPNIKRFAEYQASVFGDWKQVYIMSRGWKKHKKVSVIFKY